MEGARGALVDRVGGMRKPRGDSLTRTRGRAATAMSLGSHRLAQSALAASPTDPTAKPLVSGRSVPEFFAPRRSVRRAVRSSWAHDITSRDRKTTEMRYGAQA